MRPFPHLAALLAAVFSTHVCSPASAQDPREKPKELDVLRNYAGDWSSEVTSKPAAWTPEEVKYQTSNHAEFVLDGWFHLHIEVNHVVGDPEKVTKALMISTFDPQAAKYVTWFFQSSGIMNRSLGEWSPERKTLTLIPVEPPPNTSGKFAETFPGDSVINGTLAYTGDDGRTMFEMAWTRTRQKGLVPNPLREQWATIGTPIQPTPPEVQKLDVFLGERDVEFIHRPSIVSPQGSTAKGTTSGQWTLDGRFLLGQTKLSSFESTWVMGYDANRKAYRYVLFGSNGRMEENVGQWNEAERVFEWQLVNGPPGFTRTSITRRLDDHTLESRSVTKNGEGKVQMDLTIKGTRRK
jgi:hypothetical protein